MTFENSIEDRYGGSADADPELLENIRRDINAPFLQLVGFDKVGLTQSNYSNLKTISVRNMGVYGSGDDLESYLGNLLTGIDKKTFTREGIESIKRVFTYALFSVTHFL